MQEEPKKIDTPGRKPATPGKVLRIFLKVLLSLFLLVVLIFLLILTPPVQKFLTGKAENYLQKKIGTKVNIGSISFGLSGNVNLKDVYIADKSGDTLISGGSIYSHINLLKLFSNEVQLKDIELQNITAKIKRTLPDTVFNFQFIVDAFVKEDQKNPDTAQTAPMKLAISDVSLENVRMFYQDAVTGSDVYARIGNFTATIDSLDIYQPLASIPTIILRNSAIRIKQMKPLLTPDPLAKDIAEAAQPVPLKLSLGTIDLDKVSLDYSNDVSALYTNLAVGRLRAKGKSFDLQNNQFYLEELTLANTKSAVRLGRSPAAQVVVKEAAQEVAAQKTQGFGFRVDRISVDNNTVKFDNDNLPKQAYGMDFGHLDAQAITLHMNNLVLNPDSTAATVTKGSFREKNGFDLQELKGDLLYAKNQSYLKDLYIKTPGSEIKRAVVLEYPSLDALMKKPEQTVLNVELTDSRVQVKDILAFAPQLRKNPALARPNDTWNIHLIASGTLNRLYVQALRFNGLKDTRINAEGTLVNLMNPNAAGGNFTIHQLHTTQTDLALFTGQRLSTPQLALPETFDISGKINGNAGKVMTAVNVHTSMGNVALNGTLANFASPSKAAYNLAVRTNGLQLGTILRQPATIGSVSGNFSVKGTSLTSESMNAAYSGNIYSVGYNHYQYRNIKLNGTLRGNDFTAFVDANDPNLDLALNVKGNLASSTFAVDGMVDSVKTLPLHFSTQPVVFRGQINGRINNLNPDYLDADLLITKAVLVSNQYRLPLDTLQLLSGKNGNENYINLTSDIINASIQGQYRFSDLGLIVQNSIQPYFEVAPAKAAVVQPYHFSFRADVVYHPIFSAFLPGFTQMQPLHAEGIFASDSGMRAVLNTPLIVFAGNEMSNLNLEANTSDSGLHIVSSVGHIKSGSSWDVYNTKINATALHNVIDFNLDIADRNSRNKYAISGLVRQPSQGTYALSLKPGSLLLNYDPWTVSADNELIISPSSVTAHNFVLQKGGQQLSIKSLDGSGPPLQLAFTNFRLATITGFVKSDSLLVDGVLNGQVTFQNLAQHPAFTSNLSINDLSMRQDTIGNVNVQVSSTGNNRYNAQATITGRGNDIELGGYFEQAGNALGLNLDLDVRKIQLSSLEGAFGSFITNASGAINGNVKIRGTSTAPNIQGKLNFDTASFALTMLGSQFYIDKESISVTENGIAFDNFTIRDSADNRLNIDGTILTSNFINYDLNLNVRARDFMVLNSTRAQNSMYFGRLILSTTLNINGTEQKPVVDGTLTVNDGTNLSVVVPTPAPGVAQREGIVQFVDMDAPENDSLFARYDSLNHTSILGMDVAVNIEVKKEAILNVIVDAVNGDFLNVQGEALLSAGVDPSGKITLVGNYQLERGSYELSFNLLRRKFEIEKGSTITWTGEPTTAQLNVTAIYVANTAPLDLVEDQIQASTAAIRNTYLQKLPFEVHLTMTGELLKPIIAFDVLLPENRNYGVSNDIVAQVQGRLNQLRQDPGEINKQVFSLLLLGRFVGENPFKSSGGSDFNAGAYARQSVSRLLTEQLNNLAGGLIQGVDLNFDVASTDDYTTGERRNRTDLNIGISKRLLNDRLQVTVGSNFQLEGPQNSNQQANNIAGNVAVDYKLSKDGRYMLRFFRRNEYEGVIDGYIIENGISFILSVDFNKISEIFGRKKQRVTPDGTTTKSKEVNE